MALKIIEEEGLEEDTIDRIVLNLFGKALKDELLLERLNLLDGTDPKDNTKDVFRGFVYTKEPLYLRSARGLYNFDSSSEYDSESDSKPGPKPGKVSSFNMDDNEEN